MNTKTFNIYSLLFNMENLKIKTFFSLSSAESNLVFQVSTLKVSSSLFSKRRVVLYKLRIKYKELRYGGVCTRSTYSRCLGITEVWGGSRFLLATYWSQAMPSLVPFLLRRVPGQCTVLALVILYTLAKV